MTYKAEPEREIHGATFRVDLDATGNSCLSRSFTGLSSVAEAAAWQAKAPAETSLQTRVLVSVFRGSNSESSSEIEEFPVVWCPSNEPWTRRTRSMKRRVKALLHLHL